jgi:outer membrane protein assembly factor BamD (BamD/ComL family)
MSPKPVYSVSILLLFLLFSPLLFGQELEVVFLDGILEKKEGSSWIEVYVGDVIDRGSLVRVGSDSIVELSDGSLSVTIGTSGVFSVADLVQKVSGQTASRGLGRFLQHALEEVAGEPESRTSAAVLGARAKEVEDEKMDWIDEEEEIMQRGKALLQEGKYEEALRFFEDVEAEAIDDEAEQYNFYIGYTLAMLGKKGPALKKLSSIHPETKDSYYEDWVLVTGQLLYESMSYRKALALFEDYLKRIPEGGNSQAAYLFAGLCYRELGHGEQARENLERSYRIDPDSEIGKTAKSQL